MKNIALEVENVSKQYRLGEIGTGTLSHDLNRFWARMRGKDDPFLKIGETNDRTQKGESDYVWALKDINFKIEQGDAVGIIGRNGAGKSTLLKLLSKVTAPTTGNIKVRGRIASLLEVGTGFHPEMTGRENIFLNGAILGMTKKEIKRKFDEIVDFSGVERYIDTPVKRYSSGMYVRLAFAVAAHLESEILIVDEVLAVGDSEFQKKCLGKMGDVSKGEGRTVLFVSHNMAAVKNLCRSGICMRNGFIHKIGNSSEAIDEYFTNNKVTNIYLNDEPSTKKVFARKVTMLDSQSRAVESIENGEKLNLEIQIEVNRDISFPISFEVVIRDSDFTPVLFGPLGLMNGEVYDLNRGKYDFKLCLDLPYLARGQYYVDLILANPNIETYEFLESCLTFNIESTFNEKTSWVFTQDTHQGCVLLKGGGSKLLDNR